MAETTAQATGDWMCRRLHPPMGQTKLNPASATKCNLCGMPRESRQVTAQVTDRATELKPCPFCGGKAWCGMFHAENGGTFVDRWGAGCSRCHFHIYAMQDEGKEWPTDAQLKVTKAWNTRVDANHNEATENEPR